MLYSHISSGDSELLAGYLVCILFDLVDGFGYHPYEAKGVVLFNQFIWLIFLLPS